MSLKIYGFVISNDCDNSVDGGLKNSTSSSKSLLEGNYFAAVYIFIQDIVGMSQTWIPKKHGGGVSKMPAPAPKT